MRIAIVLVAALSLGLSACGAKSKNQLVIKGSDTEVNLVSDFAEAFMNTNQGLKISVTGGGSGTGIAALLNKQVDIANSSRFLKKDEVDKAKKAGINPTLIVIATDGVSILVHPSNPVAALSIDQISAIYEGKIKNWKEVGGPDLAITLYGRQSNSGTYEFFKEAVMHKKDFSKSINQMNGTAQIVEGVNADKTGIGYVGIGYIADESGKIKDGMKVVPVSAKDGKAVMPVETAIMDGTYPLNRPLNQYIDGAPKGAILEFLKFCVSKDAEKLVKKNGFFPVQPRYQAQNKAIGLE